MAHLQNCHQKVVLRASTSSSSFRVRRKTGTFFSLRRSFADDACRRGRRGLLRCVAESDRAKATKSGTFSSSSSSTKSSSSSVQNVLLSATLPVVVMSAVGVVGIEECLMPTEPAFAGSGGEIGNVAVVPTPDVGYYGKPNFSNVPKKGAAPRPKIEVKRRVKSSYASGPNDKQGVKISNVVSLTDEQSLAAAVVVGGVGLVSQSRAKKPQGEKPSKKPSKYKNVRIDTSKTSGGKVEVPERKFGKAKWGGDDAAKTPTMKKELVDEKTTTTSVDAATDAQKWIDDWEKNKDQVGSTTEEQEAAQKWIDQWKADGSPTDESRVEEAKKWIEEWKKNKDA